MSRLLENGLKSVNPRGYQGGQEWLWWALTDSGIPDLQDGVVFRMSRLQPASIFDGLSNVYLVGEKYVAADARDTGTDSGDTGPMMAGYSASTVRWGYEPPYRDMKGVKHPTAFGSAHYGGWNAAFGDGSVRTLSFLIDADLHAKLSSRDDINRGDLAGAPPTD